MTGLVLDVLQVFSWMEIILKRSQMTLNEAIPKSLDE